MLTTEYYLNPIHSFCLSELGISEHRFNKIGFVDIKDLTPNQLTLDNECLQDKIKGRVKNSTVYILIYNGLNIIIDGHHTVISKLIKGQTKVKAKIYLIN